MHNCAVGTAPLDDTQEPKALRYKKVQVAAQCVVSFEGSAHPVVTDLCTLHPSGSAHTRVVRPSARLYAAVTGPWARVPCAVRRVIPNLVRRGVTDESTAQSADMGAGRKRLRV